MYTMVIHQDTINEIKITTGDVLVKANKRTLTYKLNFEQILKIVSGRRDWRTFSCTPVWVHQNRIPIVNFYKDNPPNTVKMKTR